MCGILAFLSNQKIDDLIFRNMLNSISHRGPDNQTYVYEKENNLYLGHVRLSIIDLTENSNQPFKSNCDRYLILYNGEIYNFKDLKRSFFSKDKLWKTESDTELLIEMLIHIGIKKTLNLVDGQFSFILYDKKLQTITLARDIAGEKPLYFGIENGNLLISSDLKVLNRCNSFKKNIDIASINSFKIFNYINSERSIYKSFQNLKPGHFCQINLNTLEIYNYHKYHQIKIDQETNKYSKYEVIEKTEDILLKSIKKKLTSDVPLSIMLSSGVDSSLISLLIKKKFNLNINTFTVAFDDQILDESKKVLEFSNFFNIPNQVIKISKNDIINYTSIMHDVFSEPFADSSQISTFFLSKAISNSYKVSLTGDGSDEIFSGYNRHNIINKIRKFNSFQKKILNILLRLLKFNLFEKSFPYLLKLLPNNLKFNTLLYKKDLLNYFNSNLSPQEIYFNLIINFSTYINDRKSYEKLKNETLHYFVHTEECYPCLDTTSICDFFQYLPNNIFVKSDRTSMFNSLELRTPYIDKDLINFAFSIPNHMRYDKTNKSILRQILSKHSMGFKFNKSKMGFTPPINDWLRTYLKDWAGDLISDFAHKKYPFLDHAELLRCFNDHLSFKSHNGNYLWNSLVLINWLNKNSFSI